MAGTSLLALIDDIASMLDDVSVMTKVAVKKTSGVLGDDLALNAKQVSGVDAHREIPVILKVAAGSLVNKAILVPMAIGLSLYLPFLIQPLLLLGGLFLCFEGFEKILEKVILLLSANRIAESENKNDLHIVSDSEKIKGAIRTDFILSAEIIVITLGTVSDQAISKQLMVLVLISIFMTFAVYGLVAGIVKLDDLGLYLLKKTNVLLQKTGASILRIAPLLMKSLGILGTAAMFFVGGSLVHHSVPYLHELTQGMSSILIALSEALIGILSGSISLFFVHLAIKIKNKIYIHRKQNEKFKRI